MSDDPNDFQSPCVRNCCLNEDDICLGCFRTLSEILVWGEADIERRKSILEAAKKRGESFDNKYKF